MAVDVLQHHDGVVDHAADGDGQAAEREDVDGQTGHAEDGDGQEDRERDADRGDQGRARTAQEGVDDEDREEGAEQALLHQPGRGFLDEGGLVLDDVDADDVAVGRDGLLEGGLDLRRHLHRVAARLLGDAQGQRRQAVGAGIAGHLDVLLLDGGDLAQRDGLRDGGERLGQGADVGQQRATPSRLLLPRCPGHRGPLPGRRRRRARAHPR